MMFLGQNRVSDMSPTMADLNSSERAKHQILAEKHISKKNLAKIGLYIRLCILAWK